MSSSGLSGTGRPKISYEVVECIVGFNSGAPITERKLCFTHNGAKCRVVLRQGMISVGCSDITIEAARKLIDEYEKRFGCDGEVVLQP